MSPCDNETCDLNPKPNPPPRSAGRQSWTRSRRSQRTSRCFLVPAPCCCPVPLAPPHCPLTKLQLKAWDYKVKVEAEMANWEEKARKASRTGRFGKWTVDSKRHTHGALVGEQIRDRVDVVHFKFKVGPDGRWATSMSKSNEQVQYPFTPICLYAYTPIPLYPYTPIPLYPYAPMPLCPYTPELLCLSLSLLLWPPHSSQSPHLSGQSSQHSLRCGQHRGPFVNRYRFWHWCVLWGRDRHVQWGTWVHGWWCIRAHQQR